MGSEVVPRSLLESFIDSLSRDAETVSRRRGEAEAMPLRSIIHDLRNLVDDPQNIWVGVTDASRRLRKSEETIRRWCRQGTAPFRFHKTSTGEYEIWLPDLNRGEARVHAA
jgi:hypothetical protein